MGKLMRDKQRARVLLDEAAADLSAGMALRAASRYRQVLRSNRQSLSAACGLSESLRQSRVATEECVGEDSPAVNAEAYSAISPFIGTSQENHSVRGLAVFWLMESGRYPEARGLIDRFSTKYPTEFIAVQNAILLGYEGKSEKAVEIFRSLLAQPPGFLDAFDGRSTPRIRYSMGLGQELIRLGHFREGFRYWAAGQSVRPGVVSGPAWDADSKDPYIRGDDGAVAHCAGGLGDIIQFSRFLPWAASLASGPLHIAFPSSLHGLLGRPPFCTGQAIAFDKEVPVDDITLPSVKLMWLPALSGAESVPPPVPPAIPQAARKKWDHLVHTRAGAKVGLRWAGNPRHRQDIARSIRLDQLAPLAAVSGVTFYSLMVGPGSEQAANPPAGMNLVDLTADIEDWADTAALIASLDLVITVDTSACHMAGTLGIPTWTLLPNPAEWRWMLDRADSPWYPSMRLFRQQAPGDWQPVIADVRSALDALVKERTKQI